MQEPTKKHHTDNDMITLPLKVHRKNAAQVEEFARKVEAGEVRTSTIAELFPDLIDKGANIALRAYRIREDLTQRQLAEKTGIPQRHISEMENGKRVIDKEMAKRLGRVLGVDFRALL